MDTVGGGGGVFLEGGLGVRVRVRGQRRYGLFVDLLDHEGITGTIDWQDIAGPDRGRPRPDDFPIGAQFEAAVRKRLGPHSKAPRRHYLLTIPWNTGPVVSCAAAATVQAARTKAATAGERASCGHARASVESGRSLTGR